MVCAPIAAAPKFYGLTSEGKYLTPRPMPPIVRDRCLQQQLPGTDVTDDRIETTSELVPIIGFR